MAARNTRWGLWLFGFYSFFYGLFVLTNTVAPQVMEATPIGGINLAVLSGVGLIVLALVLALFYGFVARDDHGARDNRKESQP